MAALEWSRARPSPVSAADAAVALTFRGLPQLLFAAAIVTGAFACVEPFTFKLPEGSQSGLLVIEEPVGVFRGKLFPADPIVAEDPHALAVLPLPCPPETYGISEQLQPLVQSTIEVAGSRQLPSPIFGSGPMDPFPFPSIESGVLEELWVPHQTPWGRHELTRDLDAPTGLGAYESTKVLVESDGFAILAVARGTWGSVTFSPEGVRERELGRIVGPERYVRAMATLPPLPGPDEHRRIALLTVGSVSSTLSPRIDVIVRRTINWSRFESLDDERIDIDPFPGFVPRFLAADGTDQALLLVGEGVEGTTGYSIRTGGRWSTPQGLDLRFDVDHLSVRGTNAGWLVASSKENRAFRIDGSGTASLLEHSWAVPNHDGELWRFDQQSSAWTSPSGRGPVDTPRLRPGPAIAHRGRLFVDDGAQVVVLSSSRGTDCTTAEIWASPTARTDVKAFGIGSAGILVVAVDVEGWFGSWIPLTGGP